MIVWCRILSCDRYWPEWTARPGPTLDPNQNTCILPCFYTRGFTTIVCWYTQAYIDHRFSMVLLVQCKWRRCQILSFVRSVGRSVGLSERLIEPLPRLFWSTIQQSHTHNFFKYNNTTCFNSARNLGIIFDSNLSFSDHNLIHFEILQFSRIRDLRRIRNT